MSTQDIPDNELDDFFKKSLEEPDIDFREEDWLQLEKKLEIAARQKAIFRRYLYSLLFLLLVAAVSVIVWVKYTDLEKDTAVLPAGSYATGSYKANTPKNINDRKNGDKAVPSTTNAAENGPSNRDVPEQPVNTRSTQATEEKPNREEDKSQLTDTKQNKQIFTKNDPKHTTAKFDNRSKRAIPVENGHEKGVPVTGPPDVQNGLPIGKEYSIDQARNTQTLRTNRRRGKGKAVLKTPTGNTLVNAGNKPSIKKAKVGTQPLPLNEEEVEWNITGAPTSETTTEYITIETSDVNWPVLPMTQLQVKHLSAGNQLEKYASIIKNTPPEQVSGSLPAASIDINKLAKERVNYRFTVSFVVSPDLSAVRPSELAKIGTNVGLLVSYRITPKVSIITGAIRSSKVYDARTEDYSPPPGQWTYYIKPVAIKARCTVLDIPVNIRYNLLRKSHYNLYATVGMSSYLMRSENYKYIYDVDDTHLRKSWQVNNGNKHFFKVYNVSAGYEQKISERFSIGAEPFLKIPGAGVGFGKIHLWSTGIFVSVNYKLGRTAISLN